MSDDASIDELKLGSLQLEAPPDDDPLRLPNELIIDIMRHLLAAGAKWTLSNLMRANRVCHELGLPLMYREFTVNSFVDPAKVADAGYAHFVRRLDIIYIGDDTAGLERLLAAVMPRLQHLSFHVSSYSNIYLIWTALEKASSDLVSLDMDLMGDSPSFFGKIDRSFPAGVKRIGLHLDAFARPSMLFHMLESSAPGLEEIELKSEFANSDIYRRPLLVPKIRHAVTSNYMNGLAKISEATALRLRSLEVWFQKIRDVDLLQIGSLQLEHLLLRNVTTSTISKMGGLPNGIRKLTLLNPDFDARRRRRTAAVIPAEENTDNQHENRDVVETVSPLDLLRSKVVGFGVERIVIESSHWRINQASAQEEIEMWRSLPNVQIIVTR